jgi:hypothetical protein
MSIERNARRVGVAMMVAGSAALFSPATSSAEDSKYFPGSMCKVLRQPQLGIDEADVEAVPITGSALRNITNRSVIVMCPQIRDITRGVVSYAQVLARGNVTCGLFTRRWDGQDNPFQSFNADPTVDLAGDTIRIPFFSGNARGTSEPGEMWGFWCNVPAGAMIVSYEFDESDP